MPVLSWLLSAGRSGIRAVNADSRNHPRHRHSGRAAAAVHGKGQPTVRTRPACCHTRSRPAHDLPTTRFRPQPDRPSPQSQSICRSYGSILPTSLTYIVLSTRGCSPWRPAADMGTVWHKNHTTSPRFSRATIGAPDTARAAVLYGLNVHISGQADSMVRC